MFRLVLKKFEVHSENLLFIFFYKFAEIHEKNIEEDDRKNSAVFVRGRANDGTRVGKKQILHKFL